MIFFDQNEILQSVTYPEAIANLRNSFGEEYIVPQRLHYQFQSGVESEDSTLLLMPAFQNTQYIGLKLLTISPHNQLNDKPTIQGIYVLMDAKSGEIIAQLDAKSLTNLRTAAASALASTFLSNSEASSMLMIGTGALSTSMIEAHCSVRPIRQVYIWGRDFTKASKIAEGLNISDVEIIPIKSIKEKIAQVDIISTATSSQNPLVFGSDLRPGQHLDLVGAFKPSWREADDQAIIEASVFVDTRAGALKESGELLIPISKGLFSPNQVNADLFDLCRGVHSGRTNEPDITCFISVGYALEDLATSVLVWEKHLENK